MHGFRLIPRHYGTLDSILGHTPYLSRSSGVVGLRRQILVEMSSHILIFGGLIMSLLDCHTCHTSAYPLFVGIIRSLFVCAYSPYRDNESCYEILRISSSFVRCHTRAYTLYFGVI